MTIDDGLDKVASGDLPAVEAIEYLRRGISLGHEAAYEDVYQTLRSCVGHIICDKGDGLEAWIAVIRRCAVLMEDHELFSVKVDTLADVLQTKMSQSLKS